MEVKKGEFQALLKRIGLGVMVSATIAGTVSSAVEHIENSVIPAIQGISIDPLQHVQDGPYYIELNGDRDRIEEELERSNFFAVFSVVAKPSVHHDTFMGNHEKLFSELGDFNFMRLSRAYNRQDNFSIHIFLVPVPTDPDNLKLAINKIVDNSYFFFFPDESRTFHTGNLRRGNGFRIQNS